MMITKKEMIDHLNQYPDDYKLNLSHYFLVEISKETRGDNKGKEKFMQARVDIPIIGTAADKKKKEIRLVLKSSSEDVLNRIESGGIHPIPPMDDNDDDTKNSNTGEKKVASV